MSHLLRNLVISVELSFTSYESFKSEQHVTNLPNKWLLRLQDGFNAVFKLLDLIS